MNHRFLKHLLPVGMCTASLTLLIGLTACSPVPSPTISDSEATMSVTEHSAESSIPNSTSTTATSTTTAAATTAETSTTVAATSTTPSPSTRIEKKGNLTLTYNSDQSLRSTVIDAPYHSQLHPDKVPSGCETASLLTCLQSKGYALDYSLLDFVELLPYADDPDLGFWGDIWHLDKPPSTIHAAPLAAFGQQFGPTIDISGSSFTEILKDVEQGNPVVVWVTSRWQPLRWVETEIVSETRLVVDNIHVMTVIGVDYQQRMIQVSDPWDSLDGEIAEEYAEYWVDFETAEPIYEERKMALTVR